MSETLYVLFCFVVMAMVLDGIDGVKLNPIVVRGNKMYDIKTGKRFFMKGLTYGFAVSDDYYEKYGRKVFGTLLKGLEGHYNTVRLYNINPDKSYSKLMAHMQSLGLYVLVAASPDNHKYFDPYRFANMRKDKSANGEIIVKKGISTADITDSCYPSLLLEYGKKVAKVFAAYDNTLGIVVANEIMQRNLLPAACVKQYAADLKLWMRANAKFMRILPLSFAIADSSYTGNDNYQADIYGALKLQGLLCDDKQKNGVMYQSIDIFLINTYRWCVDSTFEEAYQRLVKMMSGAPIVVALGEFGCKTKPADTRTWGMVPFLFGDPTSTKTMTEIFSGGTAYSYGEASQGKDSQFPLFKGGYYKFDGEPSQKKTADYDNLVEMFKKTKIYSENAEWKENEKYKWTPKVKTTVNPGNTHVIKHGWITKCQNVKIIKSDTWITITRQGAVCKSDGSTCDVTITKRIGTTEEEMYGYVDESSGGSPCKSENDCGKFGTCADVSSTAKECKCQKCYTGPKCNIKDVKKCNELKSIKGADKIIFSVIFGFIGVIFIVFVALGISAKKASIANYDGRDTTSDTPESIPLETIKDNSSHPEDTASL